MALVQLFNTAFKYNYLNVLPCVCFIRLGGENDVSEVKRGSWNQVRIQEGQLV